jgi:F0F1-type ATP synthase assembly protein I
MVGQVGCLTLLIIIAAVFGGMWLDQKLDTKPYITITLLLAGIPLSIFSMLVIARRAISKIRSNGGDLVDEKVPKGHDRFT